MTQIIKCVGALLTSALFMFCTSPYAGAQTWASTATQAYPVQYLQNAVLVGSLAPSRQMHVVLGLQEQNAGQVQSTLKSMLNPSSPLYGKPLTVPQFAAQFGATAAQVAAAKKYLTKEGFTSVTVSPNKLVIEANGTAATVSKAFNTALMQYTLNGATVYLNNTAAQVPTSLSGIVVSVLGLNNVVSMHTALVKLHRSQNGSQSNSKNLGVHSNIDPCTPPACPVPDPDNDSYGPQQYQIAYDAACPSDNPKCPAYKFPDANNTAVGIIAEGDLTQVVTDLRTYETNYKLFQVPVTIVNAGLPSPDTSGADEWDLDSQTSTGIAQRVQHLFFYVATSMTDSDLGLAINKAVSTNRVKAFNMSFGECEFFPYLDGSMVLDDEMFGEAALQGMTPFASSGDQGSACPAVGTNGIPISGPPDTAYPATSPYVVSVGGTYLFTNADFTFDYETAADFSGGGPSYFETSPFWQAYTGTGTVPVVPSSEAGMRGVPDVSMCAGGAEVSICAANVFVDGVATLVGGTSLSSPLSMGAWARISSAHKNQLGFAAPLLYQLANGAPTLTSPIFNDVLLGTNGLYTALPGYDYVTGLGSWDIYQINKVIPSTYPQ